MASKLSTLGSRYTSTVPEGFNTPVDELKKLLPQQVPRQEPRVIPEGVGEDTGVPPLSTTLRGEVPLPAEEIGATGPYSSLNASYAEPMDPMAIAFNEEQNQRVATPNFAPDLSSEESTLATLQGIKEQGVGTQELTSAGDIKIGGMGSDLNNLSPLETIAKASNITDIATQYGKAIFTNPNSFIIRNEAVLQQYFGLENPNIPEQLKEQAMSKLPTSLLLALNKVASESLYQNRGQIGDEGMIYDREKDSEFVSAEKLMESNNLNDKETQKAIKEILSDTNRNHKAVYDQITQLAPLVKEYMYGTSPTNPDTEAGRFAGESNTVASFSVALDAINADYLSLGRDKYNALHLLPGKNLNYDVRKQLEEVAIAYDPTLKGNLFVAQKNPAVGGIPTNDTAKFIRDEQARGTDIVDIAMTLMDNIPLTANQNRLRAEEKFLADIMENAVYFRLSDNSPSGYTFLTAKQINPNNDPDMDMSEYTFAYSDSYARGALLNLTQDRFMELLDNHGIFEKDFQGNNKLNQYGEPVINRIIGSVGNNKVVQMKTHINEYLQGLVGDLWYGMMKKSPVTHRMFQRATNINWINHSGTIRGALSFGRVDQLRVESIKDLLNTSYNVGKKLQNVSAVGFQARGEKQITLFASLPYEDQLKAGTIYSLASVAHEMELTSAGQLGMKYTIPEMINSFNENTLNDLATKGESLLGWLNNGQPTPEWLKPFAKKKEFGPVIDATILAYNIKTADKVGGRNVPLDIMIEKDSSQSNAILQALTIGDKYVANMLGGNLYQNEVKDEFKNLREKAASTVKDDVIAALTGEQDEEIKESLIVFFEKAKQMTGNAFSKIYARGIVVAGLYGKHPSFMFEEVDDMLMELSIRGMGKEINALKQKYGADNFLGKSITAALTMSFYTHMPSLSMYQTIMKSLASVNAAAYGPTIWNTYGDQVINIASQYSILTNIDKNRLEKQAIDFKTRGKYTPESGGEAISLGADAEGNDLELMPRAIVRDIRATGQETASFKKKNRIEKSLANTPEGREDRGYYEGKAFKDGFAVVTTQSADSYVWAMASVVSNALMKTKKPMENLSIHDAVLSNPASVIPFLIAYNNIALPQIAKESGKMWDRFWNNTMTAKQDAIKRVNKEGAANIGRESDYAALSGFFDEIWHYSYSKPEGVLRGREAEIKRYDAKQKKNQLALKIAKENGWLPPVVSNTNAKFNTWVTPKQFETLMELLTEMSGLSDKKTSQFGISGFNLKTIEFIKFKTQLVSMLDSLNKRNGDIVNTR